MQAFTTNRLTAERVTQKDRCDLRRLYQDPQVAGWISPDGKALSEEDVERRLAHHLEHWCTRGFGMWIFRELQSQGFVGYCGLKETQAAGLDEIELFYAIFPDFWGQGLTTEMAEAVLEIGFEQLGLTEVICFTLPQNRPSQRVMEKNGFQYEKDITYAGLPHVFYRRKNVP